MLPLRPQKKFFNTIGTERRLGASPETFVNLHIADIPTDH
jgi:hypothetical protein